MPAMNMPAMPQSAMMPGMGMPMMVPMMSMEMSKDGLICKVMPMEGANMDMLRERSESMIKMMATGAPMMMMCGGSTMICTPSGK
jgi:hypothetical protein